MRKSAIIFLFISSFISAQLGQGQQSFSINGRNYDVTTPSNYDATKEYPIVFELHSFGKDRTQMHDQSVVDKQQYISVRPEGRNGIWNSWDMTLIKTLTGNSNDVGYIKSVYNDIKQKIGSVFNNEKVYIYGFSNGGAMAMKMVEETNLFKAIIVRSMSFIRGHNIPITASKIPMIFVHATGDETVPYVGGKGKFGSLSPNFESVKETVQKWASHNGLSQSTEIKYLQGSITTSKHDFYYREYSHSTYPIYFYVIEGGEHATTYQFSNANIKRALIKLIKNPKQYGIYKKW